MVIQEKLYRPIAETLKAEGLDVVIHQLPDTQNFSYIIRDVWESSGVIVACPTYEYKLFPPVAAAIEELGNKKALNRKAFYCGSFGWACKGDKDFEEIVERKRMKWDILEPVVFKGSATEDDLKILKARTKELADAVKGWE